MRFSSFVRKSISLPNSPVLGRQSEAIRGN
jgi:hypothetical protein